MGRAGRPKSNSLPELRELEEEGLPDGWNRYWHGEKHDISEGVVSAAPPIAEEDRDMAYRMLFAFAVENLGSRIPENTNKIATDLIDDQVGREIFRSYRQWLHSRDERIREAVLNKLHRSSLDESFLAVLWGKYAGGEKRAFQIAFTGTVFDGFSDEEALAELERDAPELQLVFHSAEDETDALRGTWSLQR